MDTVKMSFCVMLGDVKANVQRQAEKCRTEIKPNDPATEFPLNRHQ